MRLSDTDPQHSNEVKSSLRFSLSVKFKVRKVVSVTSAIYFQITGDIITNDTCFSVKIINQVTCYKTFIRPSFAESSFPILLECFSKQHYSCNIQSLSALSLKFVL